jgi:hypothetical protein
VTIWFSKKFNGVKRYCSKSISINFYPQHWKSYQWKSNGALKSRKEDTCYDLNIYFLGIFLSYTNWDYNIRPVIQTIKVIRKQKLDKINKI